MSKSEYFFIISDEIHSEDGYYKNPIFRNNNLVVPYINLGISEHVLNHERTLKFIDFAYLVAVDISFLSVWIPNESGSDGRQLWLMNGEQTNGIHYWSGSNLNTDSIFYAMNISCKKAFICPLPISKMTKDFWIPTKGTKLSQNMDASTVEDFFLGKMMPKDISNLIVSESN